VRVSPLNNPFHQRGGASKERKFWGLTKANVVELYGTNKDDAFAGFSAENKASWCLRLFFIINYPLVLGGKSK
jgi:hypothetical protein